MNPLCLLHVGSEGGRKLRSVQEQSHPAAQYWRDCAPGGGSLMSTPTDSWSGANAAINKGRHLGSVPASVMTTPQ
jgi:hypothetical protein